MYFGILPSPVFTQQAILKHSQHELDTWIGRKATLQNLICNLGLQVEEIGFFTLQTQKFWHGQLYAIRINPY